MLPRDNRLANRKDIEQVKKEGRMYSSTSFSILSINRRTQKPSRFAFVVSTKISPNATIRNKSTRALREGVRHSLVYLLPGYDVVFLAKPIIIKTYTDEIMREVLSALQSAGLTK